jgi:hypothetical protein
MNPAVWTARFSQLASCEVYAPSWPPNSRRCQFVCLLHRCYCCLTTPTRRKTYVYTYTPAGPPTRPQTFSYGVCALSRPALRACCFPQAAVWAALERAGACALAQRASGQALGARGRQRWGSCGIPTPPLPFDRLLPNRRLIPPAGWGGRPVLCRYVLVHNESTLPHLFFFFGRASNDAMIAPDISSPRAPRGCAAEEQA